MPRLLRWHVGSLIWALASAPLLPSAEAISSDAAAIAMKAQALADLKAGDADPRRIVAAALEFTEVLDYAKTKSDNDQICEMQADIYWCKKRMSQADVTAYLASKGDFEKHLADRAEEVAQAAVSTAQADAYLGRADAYARANPDDDLALAIRYFEVADRFAGTPASLKAQRLSLDHQRKAMASGSGHDDVVGREVKALTVEAGPLPDPVKALIAESNAAVQRITAKASTELEPVRQRTIDALLTEAAAEQRKGSLDTLLATQSQASRLDELEAGLPSAAQATMNDYAKAKRRIEEKAGVVIVGEKKRLLNALEKAQQDEVRKGDASGALAIKDLRASISSDIAAGGIGGAPHCTIVRVTYGFGRQWLDCTSWFLKQLVNGAGTVDAARIKDEVGDPVRGSAKVVRIIFNSGKGGPDADAEFPEDARIVVPIVERTPVDPRAFAFLLQGEWKTPGSNVIYTFKADGSFTDSGTWVPKNWTGYSDGTVTLFWKGGMTQSAALDRDKRLILWK